MAHHLAHENNNYGEFRDVRYTYDELNRLINVNDSKQDVFDEMFAYDAQGRITAQRRAGNVVNPTGGEYSYYSGKNRLKSVADNMGGTADERNMSDTANFVYDSVGNLTYDKYLQGEGSKNALVHFYCRTVVYCALRNSKGMEILYDWRGMPIEFIQQSQPAGSSSDTLFRLLMKYDGTGRRISKTVMHKVAGAADWDTAQVTHYTGIGTEVREEFHNGAREKVDVVVKSLQGECRKNKLACSYDRAAAADAGSVNMPQGLGRYKVADASQPADDNASRTFEWYLKNHLGSTMLVYGTVVSTDPNTADIGETKAAYDYRAFGEQVELLPHDLAKVTENFTGKEHDEEIKLDYFGARYFDPMLGMWISVDPRRQFSSPYLYAGNGYNPVNGVDLDGNIFANEAGKMLYQKAVANNFWGNEDIRREYEFANTTSTKIFVKRQYQFIGSRKLCGSTMEGVKDQINLINGVRDDYKMLEANVTLSTMGNKVWAEALNISIDEAEARIATHEFGAHIRGFSPKTNPEEREQVEHDNFMEIDQRLQIPEEPSGDDLRYQYKAYE